jgi:hypothetical protein
VKPEFARMPAILGRTGWHRGAILDSVHASIAHPGVYAAQKKQQGEKK